jgi:hypothetical protein
MQEHRLHGSGAALALNDTNRLFHAALQHGVFEEKVTANQYGGLNSNLKLGLKAGRFESEPFFMVVKVYSSPGAIKP